MPKTTIREYVVRIDERTLKMAEDLIEIRKYVPAQCERNKARLAALWLVCVPLALALTSAVVKWAWFS